eukprot:gene18192-36795_t
MRRVVATALREFESRGVGREHVIPKLKLWWMGEGEPKGYSYIYTLVERHRDMLTFVVPNTPLR